MTKPFFFILICSLMLACNKQEPAAPIEGTLIFYKSTPVNWNLVIDGDDLGPVPTLFVEPVCGSKGGLQVQLKPGTYTIEYKNMEGYPSVSPKQITVDTSSCTIYKLF